MWISFKTILYDGITNYIPVIKPNFWRKKPSWKYPISKTLNEIIKRKQTQDKVSRNQRCYYRE